MNLRVTTWNLLAQSYVKPERYVGCDPAHLAPEPRQQRIVDALVALDSDILLLQEVEQPLFDRIRAALPRHHAHLELKRGKPDGCAILSRPSLVDVGAVHYRHIEPGYDHLGIYATLTGAGITVASTHLRWQKGSVPPARHLGRLQLTELLDALPEGPSIVAGDFNTGHDGPPIIDAQARGFQLAARSLRPWDTALINGRRRKLDYQLASSTLRPSPEPLPALSKHRPIPSAEHPSDHLPLTVRYAWADA